MRNNDTVIIYSPAIII